jgi:hypothetical protein
LAANSRSKVFTSRSAVGPNQLKPTLLTSIVYLVLDPVRIQVSLEGEDPAGRTVVRNGEWVV